MTGTAERMRAAINDHRYPSNYLASCAAVADEMVQEERAGQVVTSGHKGGVLIDVVKERHRQDKLWGWIGSASKMAGDEEHVKLSVLIEEVGEVAKALLEHDNFEHVEEELVQVAAVAVAWVEAAREKRASLNRLGIQPGKQA